MIRPARRSATYQDVLDAPEHMVAELIEGELYLQPRPAQPHAEAASVLAMLLGPPFRLGRGGPGGWRIQYEPELHLGAHVLVPDLAGWQVEAVPEVDLTKAFVEDDFNGFKREARPKVKFLGLTRYYDDFEFYVVPPMNMHKLLGEVLAEAGLWQLRISETQKFAHVTSFFNGKAQEPFPGEERILIDSYKVPENEKPRMRADKIAEIAEIAIRDGIAAARKATEPEGDVHLYAQHGFDEDDARLSDTYDVFIMNFVNGDMVGHTGVFDAVVAGVEAVDDGVGRVVDAALARGGIALVTADHGNADEMLDHATGKVKTSHTLNPVEFILVSDAHKHVKMREGALGNVAPTMLQLLGLPQPAEMTSESLIESE